MVPSSERRCGWLGLDCDYVSGIVVIVHCCTICLMLLLYYLFDVVPVPLLSECVTLCLI